MLDGYGTINWSVDFTLLQLFPPQWKDLQILLLSSLFFYSHSELHCILIAALSLLKNEIEGLVFLTAVTSIKAAFRILLYMHNVAFP